MSSHLFFMESGGGTVLIKSFWWGQRCAPLSSCPLGVDRQGHRSHDGLFFQTLLGGEGGASLLYFV